MFLRSSRNAGFDVPAQLIEEALAYVNRCYDPYEGGFNYSLQSDRKRTRGMAGAGILALSLGGQHRTDMAENAAKWILGQPFHLYQVSVGIGDRYFYGAFYCSQGMFQMGGKNWDQFFPVLLDNLVNNQLPDGAWEYEINGDPMFGRPYTTALAVLAITPPYQMLPVFQR
jgi:hypothetical protein